nr:bifunctional folylpolyglutamate synthase/dihydrofolate synthase [Saprospiraceae bacterium]
MSSKPPALTNYREAVEYMYSQLPMFQRVGPKAFKADLKNIEGLAENLHHPEKSFQSIHIAGTNGKGSVSHILAAVLQQAGYRTGLYTSPHYRDFRERIKIDGEMISEDFVIDFLNRTQSMTLEIQPSFFELGVAMAFDYFRDQKVDIAVIETGLGGRLDSTNIITPVLSVITNIGFDHTQFLGETLAEIAAEKAGIIKEKVPVVIGESQSETEGVFSEVAARKNSDLSFADKNIEVSMQTLNFTHSKAEIRVRGLETTRVLKVNLLGQYQAKNLTTSLQAIFELRKLGWKITDEHLSNGLENLRTLTGFMGRMQILHSSPMVLADSAHNREGMVLLRDELQNFTYNKLLVVLAIVSDKDPKGILGNLPPSAMYFFSKAQIPRGMEQEELREKATHYGLIGESYPTVMEAYQAALKKADKKDLILVCGSIFTVAEVI